MVRRAMNFHHNKITKAAASLGITRNALYRRLEKYQIPFNDDEE
jgi:DNA-binding NtrC family response regulator